MPQWFVYLEDIEPSILVDLRYSGKNNFIGRPIDGYLRPRCIVTKETAQALKGLQSELQGIGLGLKIYDCYRPQRAVDHFVRWSKNPKDTEKKYEIVIEESYSGKVKHVWQLQTASQRLLFQARE